jgi:Zn-finger nucleic acid-binding protein
MAPDKLFALEHLLFGGPDMKCPKCNSDMEKVTFEQIEVDRCTNCKGLWFDMLEHEHLKAMQNSESIDVGKAELGKEYDKIDKIDCPVCQTQMIRMVDKDQSHIHYEACTTCYGVFFDAGEFTDYKEETVFDFFRDLFAKKRM